jgi:hypothetical protein
MTAAHERRRRPRRRRPRTGLYYHDNRDHDDWNTRSDSRPFEAG